jgi:hypothetical protein
VRGLLLAIGLVAAAAAACKSGPTARPDGSRIEARCRLVADGAICDLTNPGGRESRCFRVLLGSRRSASVITSDEACSGPLGKGETRTVAVRFPRRPALVCGPDLDEDCATKVVEGATADADALRMHGELRKKPAGAAGGAPGSVDCKALALHVYELRLKEELSYADSDEERENVESWMESDKPYILEDNETACQDAMSAEQSECMMRATTYDELRGCWELGGE